MGTELGINEPLPIFFFFFFVSTPLLRFVDIAAINLGIETLEMTHSKPQNGFHADSVGMFLVFLSQKLYVF